MNKIEKTKDSIDMSEILSGTSSKSKLQTSSKSSNAEKHRKSGKKQRDSSGLSDILSGTDSTMKSKDKSEAKPSILSGPSENKAAASKRQSVRKDSSGDLSGLLSSMLDDDSATEQKDIVNTTIDLRETHTKSADHAASASSFHESKDLIDQISEIEDKRPSSSKSSSEKSSVDYLDDLMDDAKIDDEMEEISIAVDGLISETSRIIEEVHKKREEKSEDVIVEEEEETVKDSPSPASSDSVSKLESIVDTMRSSASSNSDIMVEFVDDDQEAAQESMTLDDDFIDGDKSKVESVSMTMTDGHSVDDKSKSQTGVVSLVDDFVSTKIGSENLKSQTTTGLGDDFIESKSQAATVFGSDFVDSKSQVTGFADDFIAEEEETLDLGSASDHPPKSAAASEHTDIEDYADGEESRLSEEENHEPQTGLIKDFSSQGSAFLKSDSIEESSSSSSRRRKRHRHKQTLQLESPYKETVRGKNEQRVLREYRKVNVSIPPSRKRLAKQRQAKPVPLFEPRVLSSATLNDVNASYQATVRNSQQQLSYLHQSMMSFLVTRRMNTSMQTPAQGITLKSVEAEIQERIRRRKQDHLTESEEDLPESL